VSELALPVPLMCWRTARTARFDVGSQPASSIGDEYRPVCGDIPNQRTVTASQHVYRCAALDATIPCRARGAPDVDPHPAANVESDSEGNVMLGAFRLPARSAGSERELGRLFAAAAVIAFSAVAASPAVSEIWVTLATSGITSVAVDADSLSSMRRT
jgi:hypothetical protein